MENEEKIVAAALQHKETGLIYFHERPGRHHNVIWTLHDLGHNDKGMEQGFVTSLGRFVSREEAFTIASYAGQLLKVHKPEELFSEDVW